MEKKQQILSRIKESISTNAPNAEIILYGSRARKDNRPDSDWDILVLMDKEKISLSDEQSLRHPLYDIELDTGEIFSLLVYPKKEWVNNLKFTPLYKNIQQEGIKLK